MMSEEEKPKPKGGSGEHPAVKAFRAKLDSVEDTTLEALKDLNRQLDEEIKAHPSSRPPKKDDRRDGDSEPPVDLVELDDPAAESTKPTKEKP